MQGCIINLYKTMMLTFSESDYLGQYAMVFRPTGISGNRYASRYGKGNMSFEAVFGF